MGGFSSFCALPETNSQFAHGNLMVGRLSFPFGAKAYFAGANC